MTRLYAKAAIAFIDACMYAFLAYCVAFGAPEFFLKLIIK